MSIKVNFAAMEAGAGRLSTASSSINASLNDLRNYLQPLVAEWDGEARNQYLEHQRKWDEAAAALNDTLAKIGNAVAAANENYQGAEGANKQIWS